MSAEHVPNQEETEDALLEGDRAYRKGSARAALAHRDFRLVWSGSLASNVGTWMQNAALGALASQTPTIPIVVLSASEDLNDVRQVLDAGAMGFHTGDAALSSRREDIRRSSI